MRTTTVPADEASTPSGRLAITQATALRVADVPRRSLPSYTVEMVGALTYTPIQVAGLGTRCPPAIACSQRVVLHYRRGLGRFILPYSL